MFEVGTEVESERWGKGRVIAVIESAILPYVVEFYSPGHINRYNPHGRDITNLTENSIRAVSNGISYKFANIYRHNQFGCARKTISECDPGFNDKPINRIRLKFKAGTLYRVDLIPLEATDANHLEYPQTENKPEPETVKKEPDEVKVVIDNIISNVKENLDVNGLVAGILTGIMTKKDNQ